jgi:predicted lipid-binding transport protein (Tim44 family)
MNVLSPAKAQQRFTTNKTATKTPNSNPNRDVPTAKSTATSPQAQPMTAGMAGGVGGGMMGNFIGTAVSAVVGSVIGNSIAHALFGGFGGGQAMAPQQPPAVDANGNPLPAPTSPSNPLQGMIGFFWGLITLGFQLFLVAVLGLFGFKFLRKLWVGTKP